MCDDKCSICFLVSTVFTNHVSPSGSRRIPTVHCVEPSYLLRLRKTFFLVFSKVSLRLKTVIVLLWFKKTQSFFFWWTQSIGKYLYGLLFFSWCVDINLFSFDYFSYFSHGRVAFLHIDQLLFGVNPNSDLFSPYLFFFSSYFFSFSICVSKYIFNWVLRIIWKL